jgi:hypothetical protein
VSLPAGRLVSAFVAFSPSFSAIISEISGQILDYFLPQITQKAQINAYEISSFG